ncbi:hypothetical protein DM01DRAFT_1383357 [Hesseltinella vesiculosa]|uniref:Ricin B lectin domain-containing protein n=1 Tax=Hesseltinella vesiculosa TaxID=101127 RepID=A0A1X2GHG9_9FUNG|nr:hypothetical protein DM01DRAFT_1383357 [Hesseltinella vesiculosa]
MRFSTVFLIASSMIAGLSAQGGTSPTAKQDGTALYTSGVKLAEGFYEIAPTGGNGVLAMLDPNNLLQASTAQSSVWELRQHKSTKFFSLHISNQANLEKCISTRWTVGDSSTNGGYPDAAVMWQCEIDGSMPKSTGGYQKIYPPKQLWLAVPDQKVRGQYKIVSASHLYDMDPRCISQKTISGGTTLTVCKIDTQDSNLLWSLKPSSSKSASSSSN